jgi:hypothetical protein
MADRLTLLATVSRFVWPAPNLESSVAAVTGAGKEVLLGASKAALRHSIVGSLLLSGDAGYEQARRRLPVPEFQGTDSMQIF